jgi:hypothetical protein
MLGGDGTEPAGVSGFGVVFSDVDLLGPTTIEYFDRRTERSILTRPNT